MRFYTVQGNATVTTAITVLQLTAPSTMVLMVTRAWLNQESVTTNAQWSWQVLRKTATATGLTTATPVKHDPGDPSPSATAGTIATGEGTAGDVLWRGGFNLLNGDQNWATPEERWYVQPSGMIAIKFPNAPTSAVYNFGFTFAEIG